MVLNIIPKSMTNPYKNHARKSDATNIENHQNGIPNRADINQKRFKNYVEVLCENGARASSSGTLFEPQGYNLKDSTGGDLPKSFRGKAAVPPPR